METIRVEYKVYIEVVETKTEGTILLLHLLILYCYCYE